MRAGQLRHKVEILTPTSAVSDIGEIETGTQSLGTFYADVMARTASEVNDNNTLKATTSFTVMLRYNTTDLTTIPPNATLLFEGQTLLVRSVALADYRKRIINITAEVTQ